MAKNNNPKKTKKSLEPVWEYYSKWLEPIWQYCLKWLESIWQCCLNWWKFCSPLIPRFVLLVMAAAFGSFLLKNCCSESLIKFFNINECSRFIESFQLLLLGLPVFVLLWFFRTHDTKTQINQADYFKGLDNLASNDVLKIAIGARQLVALRKTTKQYDKGIAIAFAQLFQSRKKNKTKEERNQKIDLRPIDFSDIYLSGANLSNADLRVATLTGADLSGAGLLGADLISAKLIGADLSGADLVLVYLIFADLSEANLSRADLRGADLRIATLTGADLSGAKLIGADLSEAVLFGADLSRADLEKVKLMEADLSYADFSKAKNLDSARFEGAFYAIDKSPKNIDFKGLRYSLKEDKAYEMDIVRINKKPD